MNDQQPILKPSPGASGFPFLWGQYLQNAWPIFPLYSFYEVCGTKLPWNNSDRVFIYSTVASNNVWFVHNQTTTFFNIYEVIYGRVHNNIIGYVFCVRPPYHGRRIKIRYSTKCISVLTPEASKARVSACTRKVLLDSHGITAVAYGSDAEVITDLPYIMRIGVD